MNQSLWLHPRTGTFFVGTQEVTQLSPLQRRLLEVFLDNPNTYLTKTEIIEAAWPQEVARMGVSDAALQRQISSLRQLLEVYSEQEFITTWRGIPEGGYRMINCRSAAPIMLPIAF
jgi:DNA-binding response OmpR family regulator